MSEKKDKPHVSVSQLETYAKCPQQWAFRYVEKLKRPPGFAMHIGSGVHAGAEANFHQKIETFEDLKVEDVVDIAVANFEHRYEESGVELDEKEKEAGLEAALATAKDETVRLAKFHREEVQPTYQPHHVEDYFRIELPKLTHDLVGILDLHADEIDEKRNIISPSIISDFKTSKKRFNQAEADNSYQLTAYAVAAKRMYGKLPSRLQLDVTVKLKKAPARQVIETTRSAADFVAFKNRLVVTIDSIKTGVFPPAPMGAWWCAPKWCGYWNDCPHVNSDRTAAAQATEK